MFASFPSEFVFSLQLAPFPSRLFRRSEVLILQSQFINCSAVSPLLINRRSLTFVNGTFFLTPRYYGLSLIRTLELLHSSYCSYCKKHYYKILDLQFYPVLAFQFLSEKFYISFSVPVTDTIYLDLSIYGCRSQFKDLMF